MRRKYWSVFIIISLLLVSCNKDDGPYVSVKGIENLIYLSIKAYRADNGLTGPFVHQFLAVGEAQVYSYKMAHGVEEVGTQGLDEHWDALNEKYSFYNEHALVLKTDALDEDVILTQLLELPNADSILLEDVTQCGVGVEADTEGFNYVTVLLMKADS
jgi:hypothetical protein